MGHRIVAIEAPPIEPDIHILPDTPVQGAGWWMASDGKWYPPHLAPGYRSPVAPITPAAPASRTQVVARIGIVLSVLLAVVGICAASIRLGQAEPEFTRVAGAIDTPRADGTTPAVAAAEVPEGYRLLTGEGVSLAAPEDWQDLDTDVLGLTPDRLAEMFPDLDPALAQGASAILEQGALVFAVDMSGDTRGYNVSVLTTPQTSPADVIAEVLPDALESTGIVVRESGVVDLPAGEAVRLVLSSVGGTELDAVQYYVPGDDVTYVVTVTGDAGLGDGMMQTFRTAPATPTGTSA
jgi:hypothetical protein